MFSTHLSLSQMLLWPAMTASHLLSLSLCTPPPPGLSWRSCCSFRKWTCMHDWRPGYSHVTILITILPQNVTDQFSCMILNFLTLRFHVRSLQQFLVSTSSCLLIHGIFCKHFLRNSSIALSAALFIFFVSQPSTGSLYSTVIQNNYTPRLMPDVFAVFSAFVVSVHSSWSSSVMATKMLFCHVVIRFTN